MQPKLLRFFLLSAGLLLLLTAAAKLISACGSALVLQLPDPILGIRIRFVLCIVGTAELGLALVCIFGKRTDVGTGCVAWLATMFGVYRLGLLWIGYNKPCPCFGNVTDALHLSPEVVDVAMKIVLGYLLIGSYTALIWLWIRGDGTGDSLQEPDVTNGVL